MTTSATGESQKQSELRKKLDAAKAAAEIAHKITTLAKLTSPVGKWRLAVRGFAASNFRSAMRLKLIAQVRAETIAARMSRKALQPGQPRFSRAATSIAASANGS